MKILYLGTVCNVANYEKEIKNYKIKPSVAPLTFESALMKGFSENGTDIDVISFPMLPAYPGCNRLLIKEKQEILESGYKTTWIRAINIVGLKQWTQSFFSKFLIKKWFRHNKHEDKAILIYSIYQPVAKNVIKYAKKYHTPCIAIVPDLPRDMYANKSINSLKKVLTSIYTKKALKLQGDFDGYVYLTDAMSQEVNVQKPYIVVEGVANETDGVGVLEKNRKRAIMYAGALGEKYGLGNLLEAFKRTDIDAELWIFGTGDYEDKVIEYTKLDSRIKFFGRKERTEILKFEKKASLLVNVRSCKEEFTKFSFPSKTIEYMISGTPMLTTKLQGIPEEYFKHLFWIGNNDVKTIQEKIEEIMKLSDDELNEMGRKAQQFIKNNKNGKAQSNKILEFISFLKGRK